jgi:endonuclease-3
MPRKSKITASKLLDIYKRLEKRYGARECPLIHNSAYELFVAVVLSAQCTDKRVNTVTPNIFKNYPDVKSLSEAKQKDLEEIIHSLGFFSAKSKSLIAASQQIVKDFDSKVPGDMESLTSLRGVGRKTANVILGNAFGVPGFPVDTHVIRLMNRFGGLVKTKDPVKIEMIINTNIEKKYWTDFSHLLITHGRECCRARKPDCEACDLECKARLVEYRRDK